MDELFQSSFTYDTKSLEQRMIDSQSEFKQIYEKTKEYILKRQEKLLLKLNKHRHPHNFSVGDLVFVKLDNLKQLYFHKNRPIFDLYIWKVLQVKRLIIKVENLVTAEVKILSPQQLKKLQQDKLNLYELPKEVKRYFKLLTVEDVKNFNEIRHNVNLIENREYIMESDTELSSLDSTISSLDNMSDFSEKDN